jgi:phosphatidylserine decarboxylase
MIASIIIIALLDTLRIGVSHLFNIGIPSLWWIGIPFLVFAFYFFRNPDRVTPTGENLIIAPADGIVSNIKPVVPPKELGLGDKPMTRISIFMSVFNVHVNRSPVSGVVDQLKYRPGKFVSVAEKDSEDNERQEIAIIADNGVKIGVVQIAGLVARRIYCPLKVGQKLKAGEIFGMIRFGSRLDVFLPEGVYPKVMLGQVAVAGETILADMNNITPKSQTEKEPSKGKK